MRRGLYLPILLLILIALAWSERRWGASAQASKSSDLGPQSVNLLRRWVDWAEEVVGAEQKYHRDHGRFTSVLSRLGLETPAFVAENTSVEVRILDSQHFILASVWEGESSVPLRLITNERFEWLSSFSLPSPEIESLRHSAQRELRLGLAHNTGAGFYPGYFAYEGGRAQGIREPVLDLRVGPAGEETRDLASALEIEAFDPSTGRAGSEGALQIEPVRGGL